MIDPKVGDYLAIVMDISTNKHFRVVLVESLNSTDRLLITVRMVPRLGEGYSSAIILFEEDRFATDTEILEAKLRYGL